MEKSQSAPAVLEKYILDEKQYVDSNKIGVGTFGTVFRIPSPELKRKTNAVKVCESELGRQFLQKEWEIMKSLDHPNIVKVEVTDSLYILPKRSLMVMEDVQGSDLLELLTKAYAPDLAVVHIARCMLRALEYIHQNAFVHKDLKAENILVGTSDVQDVSLSTNVKLCDFGLACHRKSVCVFDHTGSLDYCAPEIVLAAVKEPYALDLYSFSVVFYVLCYSGLPVEISDRESIISKGIYTRGIKDALKRRDRQFSDKHFRSVYKHSARFTPAKRYPAAKLLNLKVFSDKFVLDLVDLEESTDSAETFLTNE